MKPSGLTLFLRNGFYAGINASRRLTIYKRLILSFLVIILIPNLIIGYYSYTISTGELEKNISRSTGQVLRDVATTINTRLNLYEGTAARISSNDQLRTLLDRSRSIYSLKESNEDARKQYEENRREIGQILFQAASSLDISNMEILCEYSEFNQIDYADKIRGASLKDPEEYRKKEIYRKALEADGTAVWADTSKELGVFRYEDSATSNIGSYVTLLKSIPDIGQNKPFGVILITIPVYVFNGLIDLQDMYAKNEILLLTGKQGVLSLLNKNYFITRVPDKDILQETIRLKRGTITRKISGSDTMIIYDTLGKMDLSLVYSVERNEIFKGVFQVRNIILEVSLLCILCAVLLSYFVTASISSPLNRLKRAMAEVENNGLELRYHDPQRDEIGILGQRFNEMLAQIRSLLDNILHTELLRKNEEIRRKEAELDALQMQIKPHFLYNTLDLIRCNAMLQEQGDGKISRMILAFSSLLRFNTINAGKLVNIDEEIGHVLAYVNVMKDIKKLKIDVTFDIEDPLLRLNKITKLTLQPIIENAVKYGAADLTEESALLLAIRIFRQEGSVFLEVTDNGAGIPEAQLRVLNAGLESGALPGRSIGLRNVNERIRLFFGEQYGVRLFSEEGKYTTVRICIPDIVDTLPEKSS